MRTIVIDDDELSCTLLEEYISKTAPLQFVQHFKSPIEALSFLASNKVDLILLDIEMSEMNGIEFLATLKSPRPHIVLVTSHKEFALEAFEYHVQDYLVKPFTYARFFKAVSSTLEKEDAPHVLNDDDFVFVKKENQIIQIRKSEIIWVEALGDYAALNTAKERFILHTTLKTIAEKLPKEKYLRVHRSYIVRMDKIEKIEDDTIFCSGKTFPIGKSYRDEVFRKLKMF